MISHQGGLVCLYEILDLCLDVIIFEAWHLLPRIMPKECIIPILDLPEVVLMNEGSLIIGGFPYRGEQKVLIKYD